MALFDPASARPALLALPLLGLLFAGCPARGTVDPQVKAVDMARLEEHRLRGIALMENRQFINAEAEFRAITAAAPRLGLGHVNLALSLASQPTKVAAASAPAAEGVKLLPSEPWPLLVQSKVLRTLSPPRLNEATDALRKAAALAPGNARVVGALVQQLRSIPGDQAQPLYEARKQLASAAPDNLVVQLDWALAQAERQEHSGALAALDAAVDLLPRIPADAEAPLAEARRALEQDSTTADRAIMLFTNVLKGAFTSNGLPYWKLGQSAAYGNDSDPADLVLREWLQPTPSPERPAESKSTLTWTDVTDEAGLGSVAARGLAPAAIADIDLPPDAGRRSEAGIRLQDAPDLVVGGPEMGLLLNTGGRFAAPGGPLQPGSPLLADLNNDYALDLYVATSQGDQVWKNPLSGEVKAEDNSIAYQSSFGPMQPQSAPAGPRGEGVPLAVDIDQDGDLDIIRPSSSPDQPIFRYLRNNGDFTFTDLTKQAGVAEKSRGARQAVFADFDGDGDPDIFVVQQGAGPRLYLNERQDIFTDASREWGLPDDPGGLSASVADFNRDGHWDVVVAGGAGHGVRIFLNSGKGSFQVTTLDGASEASWVEAIDWDNDTWIDLALAGPDGVTLFRGGQDGFSPAGTALEAEADWLQTFDWDMDGDYDILARTKDGRLRLLRNDGGNQRAWMRVEMRGLTKPEGQAVNVFGIGNVVEALTPWDQQKVLVQRPQTLLGLGVAKEAVALRVLWTNGVPDDAIAPPAEAVTHYIQTPRGSCPFLYTWDGEKYRFAFDFNWRSPLGMTAGRGRGVPHDQTGDWVKIPEGGLASTAGFYRMIATEELREVSYFDMMQLIAVDHPAESEIYLDERFPFGPALPFRIYTAREHRLPRTATDGAGHDLLPRLREADGDYTPVPATQGYRGIVAPHELILDLGDLPDPSRVQLFLNGWIYPASPSGNLAASQNPNIKVIPPTLYAGDGKGGWREIDRTVGLPCGKRKTIVLDLSGKLNPRDPRVRLVTTMEIRWDAAFWTSGEEPAPLRRTVLPLVEADLRPGAYSRMVHDSEEDPHLFNYNDPLSEEQAPRWRPIEGRYTRWGDCTPLLREIDDRSAIVGPGEEIGLLFDGRNLPALRPGWKRSFIFKTDGWTKDTDPNTLTGETVAPLPFHGMKTYPPGPNDRPADPAAFRRWDREWNTRRAAPRSVGIPAHGTP